MNRITKAWGQYEAGKEYKRRIGLYETIRTNERFYRGDQWYGNQANGLPKPVFNIIRRVIDYLVCSVASSDISIRYTDENLPFLKDKDEADSLRSALEVMTKNAAYRWEKDRMSRKVFRLLTDAAISGDGVLYCYWNPEVKSAQPFSGDIVTEVIDSVNLCVADVNKADIQSQEYIILAGRASVASLKREAIRYGVDPEQAKLITADGKKNEQSGDMSLYELDGEDEEKTTYIIKFWREDGKVVFEKSVRECVIRRVYTSCTLYPVAYFNWCPTKNSFHGTSPVSALIPNQKFINRAYAMAMKHMTDTAFSKVVYDKSKIPEWSNEVGEAIAAVGGGNISDAVSVVGVGNMQSGYMELIESAIDKTKELMGANETALGDAVASNTSAILALQETSRIPLLQVRSGYYQCIEDMADIWADMMCAYYPSERLLPFAEHGKPDAAEVDFSLLRRGLLSARIDVAEISRYSAVSAQNMLDKLFDGGYITAEDYVRRLPSGLVFDREALIEEISGRSNSDDKAEKV